MEEGTEVALTVETSEASGTGSPFEACCGGRRDLVDTEALLRDIYERRGISSSREVNF